MSRLRIAVLIPALALAAACVRTSTVQLGAPMAYPPVAFEEVQVFLTEGDVPGEFVKIALINAEAASSWTNEKGMVDKVRREAGKLGANGVIIDDIKEPSAGAKVAGAVFGVPANRHGKVVAIRFTPIPPK